MKNTQTIKKNRCVFQISRFCWFVYGVCYGQSTVFLRQRTTTRKITNTIQFHYYYYITYESCNRSKTAYPLTSATSTLKVLRCSIVKPNPKTWVRSGTRDGSTDKIWRHKRNIFSLYEFNYTRLVFYKGICDPRHWWCRMHTKVHNTDSSKVKRRNNISPRCYSLTRAYRRMLAASNNHDEIQSGFRTSYMIFSLRFCSPVWNVFIFTAFPFFFFSQYSTDSGTLHGLTKTVPRRKCVDLFRTQNNQTRRRPSEIRKVTRAQWSETNLRATAAACHPRVTRYYYYYYYHHTIFLNVYGKRENKNVVYYYCCYCVVTVVPRVYGECGMF